MRCPGAQPDQLCTHENPHHQVFRNALERSDSKGCEEVSEVKKTFASQLFTQVPTHTKLAIFTAWTLYFSKLFLKMYLSGKTTKRAGPV